MSETNAARLALLTDTTASGAPVNAGAARPIDPNRAVGLGEGPVTTLESQVMTQVAAGTAAADVSHPSRAWMTATEVEAPAPFTWSGDLLLGEGLKDGDKRAEFQARAMTGRAVNFRMQDVTLLPSTGLLCKAGTPIAETRYGLRREEERAAVASLSDGPHARLAGRRVFVGLNRFCGNYFHMLTQIVPAFAAYDTDPDFSDGLLLLGTVSAALHRALRLAGRNTANAVQALAVRPGIPIDIEDLTYSSFLNQCDDPSTFRRTLFNRMAERATTAGPRLALPAIYVSRTDSAMRPMRNEDELIATLSRFGIAPVVLSKLTLDEQIVLFRNARLIVAPHGAGLANVVFARPGTVVYELFPSSYISSCINRLAQTHGLHYWCDVYQAENRPELWHHHTPWLVDIAQLERRLRDLRTVYGVLLA